MFDFRELFNMNVGSDPLVVPKDLEKCYGEDSTSQDLERISAAIGFSGGALTLGLLALGFLVSISATAEISGGFEMFISTYAPWAIGAIIVSTVSNFFSILVKAISSIVHSTRVSANVALYLASKDSTSFVGAEAADSESVAVPVESQDTELFSENTEIATPAQPIAAGDGMIRCPSCGKQQLANRTVCWSCGQKFTE